MVQNNYVSVIFCRQCGSRYVEISEWANSETAILHCRSCDKQEEISGFTLGRCNLDNVQLQRARDTQAKKNKYEK